MKLERTQLTELDDRLVRCFSSIFPALTEEEIRAVDVERLDDMDSLAGVTLVSLIGQEFGVEMDMDDLLRLRTFDAVQRYLREIHLPSSLPRSRC